MRIVITGGYPFLVSRICQLVDEGDKEWTRAGIVDAVKHILAENNPLFDDMRKKLEDYPELRAMLCAILFQGRTFPYNPDNADIF